MTRINTIAVEHLLDQHLFAEYREITRVSSLARPLNLYGTYTMGTGHVKFFYNKGGYLATRCAELLAELSARGYNATPKEYKPHAVGLNCDWQPSAHDQLVNLLRLHEKLVDKPTFYKLRGKAVDKDYYTRIIRSITS